MEQIDKTAEIVRPKKMAFLGLNFWILDNIYIYVYPHM